MRFINIHNHIPYDSHLVVNYMYMGVHVLISISNICTSNIMLTTQEGDSAVIQATVRHESGALQELVSAGADLNLQNEVRHS